jgi:hypothetical protein
MWGGNIANDDDNDNDTPRVKHNLLLRVVATAGGPVLWVPLSSMSWGNSCDTSLDEKGDSAIEDVVAMLTRKQLARKEVVQWVREQELGWC